MTELLFNAEDLCPWLREWQNMPEYDNQDLSPQYQVLVSFTCKADVIEFGELIGQKVSGCGNRYVTSIWFPTQEIGRAANKRYIEKR